MANNCLVTKLKSVVENDSLPKMGELRVTTDYPADPNIIYMLKFFSTTHTLNLKVVEGLGFFDVNGNFLGYETQIPPSDFQTTPPIYCKARNVISIDNKYALQGLSGWFILDLDDLKYSKDLSYLHFNTSNEHCITGNINDITGPILSEFNIVGYNASDLYGDTATIVSKFPELRTFNVGINTNITGDYGDFLSLEVLGSLGGRMQNVANLESNLEAFQQKGVQIV